MPIKPLRVMVLMHQDLMPPDELDGINPDSAEWRNSNVNWKTEFDVTYHLKKLGHQTLPVGVHSDLSVIRQSIQKWKPDIVFNLLEEFDDYATYDQNIVSYLELQKVPYTGCNPRGLMLARDKAISKKILSFHRIHCPKFHVVKKGQTPHLPKSFTYPVIVKSLIEEGSLGISQGSVVESREKLVERVKYIHNQIQTDAIIESYIEGREFYVGILGNHKLEVLPIWELEFKNVPNDFVPIATSRVKWNSTYREKYGIRSVKAVDLTENEIKTISETCKKIYKRLELNGYARIDLRYTPEKEIYVIEANPNPGIALGEEFSESAEMKGYSYNELLQKVIRLGLSWFENRN